MDTLEPFEDAHEGRRKHVPEELCPRHTCGRCAWFELQSDLGERAVLVKTHPKNRADV